MLQHNVRHLIGLYYEARGISGISSDADHEIVNRIKEELELDSMSDSYFLDTIKGVAQGFNISASNLFTSFSNSGEYNYDGMDRRANNLRLQATERLERKLETAERRGIPASGRAVVEGERSENQGTVRETGERVFGEEESPREGVDNKLVATHNISVSNLLKADKLGGLPVPSIGITKASSPYSDFGSITLIGTEDMVNPANDVPVFSQDAYSNRFPTLNYSKSVKKTAEKTVEKLFAPFKSLDEHGYRNILYSLKTEPNLENVEYWLSNSVMGKAAFLNEQGITLEPVMTDRRESYEFTSDSNIQQIALEAESFCLLN